MGLIRVNSRRIALLTLSPIMVMLLVGEWYLYHSRGTDVPRYNCQDPATALEMDLVVSPYFHYDASDEALRQREMEYMIALQRNLNHNFVRRIHILTTNAEELTRRLEKFELSSQSKLLVIELKRIVMTRDVFEYISQNLIGSNVMFLNGDIYLGSGYNCVDPTIMRESRIMYALTRQAKEEESCGESDYCFESQYRGSHDAFLFHLTEPFPQSALEHLEFLHPSLGMENIIIWIFKTKLKYCVLNPCSILEVFHLHCSALRNYIDIDRVNDESNSGLSPFTKDLVCNSNQQVPPN